MSGASNRGAQQSLLGGWFSGALDEVERERQAAEAAGREVYERALRAGQDVRARTRAELIALGRSKLAQDAGNIAKKTAQAARDPKTWHDAEMQGDAAIRSFSNTATFGLADHIAAFGDAVGDAIDEGRLSTAFQRYEANLQDQQARDGYDIQHRPVAALAGGLAADLALYKGVGGRAERWASGLSPNRKGQLGEDLSAVKTVMKGDWPSGAHEPFEVSGGETYVDHPTIRDNLVEAKFGPNARLSPRQRAAQQEYGERYRVDRWGPKDVGRIAGGAAAANWPIAWPFKRSGDRQ